MKQNIEYVITESNQPSKKAVREFHEHVYEFMVQTTEPENESDSPTRE